MFNIPFRTLEIIARMFTVTDPENLGREVEGISSLWKKISIEIYFSFLERIMGKVIRAVKPDYIAQEISMKAVYYKDLRHMIEAC